MLPMNIDGDIAARFPLLTLALLAFEPLTERVEEAGQRLGETAPGLADVVVRSTVRGSAAKDGTEEGKDNRPGENALGVDDLSLKS